MKTRKGVLAGFGALAAGVLIGGAAWACTPQASLRANPTAGTAGSTITMSGGTFDASGGPIKIWFDGAGRTQIGTATVNADRTFSAQVVVPASAGAGTHIISATQSDANGQPIAGSPVNTTFRVEGPAAAPSAPANLQGSAPQDAQGAEALAPISEAAPAVQAAPAPAAAPVATPVRTPARVTTPAPAVATPAPAPAPAAEVAPAPAVATPAPVVTPAPAPAPAPVTPAPAVEAAPAPAASSDDSGSSGWVVAGLAILAFGLFAVGGGIFLTERKRSRARS